jgi:penicillin-binding protein 1C
VPWRRLLVLGTGVVASTVVLVAVCTRADLSPPDSLRPHGASKPRIVARDGAILSLSYMDPWNVHDTVSYHEVPELLREAFLHAEDKRFFAHQGVDWLARAHAVAQAVQAGRIVRGASTITEQVVRILRPRPRNLWSRWLEGIEAGIVEGRFSKTEIIECYLNQVPYARNRRGVVQAARSYFDRDLDTLNAAEMLALAVLVRSPSRLDLASGSDEIREPLERLARRLRLRGVLSDAELAEILSFPLAVVRPKLEVDAAHFVRFARASLAQREGAAGRRGDLPTKVITTLDPSLQARVRQILDRQVEDLIPRGVGDGAALVIDHDRDEILAWVCAFGFADRPGGQIDKLTMARQPGSTLKPFLYALALERGWTAATLIDDSPLSDSVGHGLHSYRNYSRVFYGPLRLREALGNSLNIPAVRAARFVGAESFLERLRNVGFESLSQSADFYGDGLALGNGEVTLYELVRAYAVLARGGVYRQLRWRVGSTGGERLSRELYSPELSSVIANILSDPNARSREFGHDSVLDLPIQTAVKTGTSTDHRDAWAVGFSHRYTVGVWMGNIDGRPTDEVSGSQGPALVGLLATQSCPTAVEYFRESTRPPKPCVLHGSSAATGAAGPLADFAPRLASPIDGLHLAEDPRIPDSLERFPLRIARAEGVRRTEWLVDGRVVGSTGSSDTDWLWPVERGRHTAQARVWFAGVDPPVLTGAVEFLVK